MRAPRYQSQTQAPQGSQVRLVAPDTGGVEAGFARGLQSAARGIGQYAEAELAIQERHNDLHSRKLSLEYQNAVAPMLAEYDQLQGEDSIAQAKAVRERLVALRRDFADRAGNGRMREMFMLRTDEAALRYDNSIIAKQAGAQFKFDLDTTNAEMVAAQTSAAANYNSPEQHSADLSKVRAAALRISDLNGVPAEQARLEAIGAVSTARFSALNQMIANEEIDMAIAYLDAFGDELTPDHRTRASSALRNPIENREADAMLMQIASGSFSTASGTSPAGADAGGGVASSAPTGSASLQLPVGNARVSSGYGMRTHPTKGGRQMHHGIDYAVPAGTAIKPAAEGVVSRNFWDEGGGGWVVSVKHADGHETSYLHMGSKSPLSVGDRVTRSTVIGTVGSTGSSTGPHLDFRVKDAQGQWIDPEKYLKGAVPLGTTDDPRQWDKVGMYAKIDELEQSGAISLERADRMRSRLDQRVARDNQLINLAEQETVKAVNEWLMKGNNLTTFTDVSQLPDEIRNMPGFTPALFIKYQQMAEGNKSSSADPSINAFLTGLKVVSPESFREIDLTQYAPGLTQSQYAALATAQIKAKKDYEQGIVNFDPSTGIRTAFNLGQTLDGKDGKLNDVDSANTLALMESFANKRFKDNGGKPLTDADYMDAYRYATQKVEAKRPGLLWGETREQLPRYQIEGSVERAIADNKQTRQQRARVRAQNADIERLRSEFFRRNRRFPTQQELDFLLAQLER